MTRYRLNIYVWLVSLFYFVMIGFGAWLKWRNPTERFDPLYTTFKDLTPLLIALPAAGLGFCFSRRSAYVQQLRDVWSKIVDGVQCAVQYLHADRDNKELGEVIARLNTAKNEVRGVFENRTDGRPNKPPALASPPNRIASSS